MSGGTIRGGATGKSRAAYRELELRFARMSHLNGAKAVLHWDSATMMPPGGAEARAEQLATLTLIGHDLLTDPSLAGLLDAAEGGEDVLDEWQAANLREMRRHWRHASAVPGELAVARSRAASACEMAWRSARADDDFAALARLLDEVICRVREVAAAKAEALGCTPYDALLDGYDPGLRVAEVDRVFADLEAYLPGFIDQAQAHQASLPPPVPLDGPFPQAAQRRLAERLMAALGLEAEHSRLDVSLHPFSGGVPDDVRITTRYRDDDFTDSLMAVLHETGHALYERGLPQRWRHQPVGRSRGMSLHESQSLLIEMHTCRSREFIGFLAPLLADAFGGSGPAWQTDNMRRRSWWIEPGLIRVDADEATYPLHIIMRTRLERAMIDGDLGAADLPAAWREGMARWLGVTPQDDRDGCMQDIHWYDGDFGYFPTYTLGALAAAQLFAAAQRADAAILPEIAVGEFAPLLAWLRTHVHRYASLRSTDEILSRATGAPLGTAAFKRHLEARSLA